MGEKEDSGDHHQIVLIVVLAHVLMTIYYCPLGQVEGLLASFLMEMIKAAFSYTVSNLDWRLRITKPHWEHFRITQPRESRLAMIANLD